MATRKFYGYYIEGNKIGLAQKESGTTSTDLRSEDYGKYKSPQDSVTDGLEIKYTYMPEWQIVAGADESGANRFFNPLAYTSANGNCLSFILPGVSFLDTFGGSETWDVGDNILIQGSSRWNGIHEIKNKYTNGLISTTTPFQSTNPLGGSIAIAVDVSNTNKTITGDTDAVKANINDLFPSGTHYCFTGGTDAAAEGLNMGLFKVTSDNTGVLTIVEKLTLVNGTITTTAAADVTLTDDDADTMSLSKAYLDNSFMYHDASFSLMEDESFEIDLPRYLQNALVLYLKAKKFEDSGEFEAMQFYLREFKRQVEKHNGSKVTTTHRMSGFPIMNRKF